MLGMSVKKKPAQCGKGKTKHEPTVNQTNGIVGNMKEEHGQRCEVHKYLL